MNRDIFIVCNNVEELGGLQRWAHDIGRMFAARGHRVRLVGIAHADRRHDYGQDPPYATTVLHERRPRVRLGHRATVRLGAARLSGLFAAARPGGVIIAAQV